MEPFDRVALHDGEFFVGEFSRLVQDEVRHSDFPDVVERRRALELCDVGVVDDVRELAFALQFLRDGLHVEGCLLDVASGTCVAHFDHFCEVDNNFVLHLRDAIGCRLEPVDEFDGVDSHLVDGLVEVLYFVGGADIQGVEFAEAVFATLFQVVGEVDGRRGDPVHRMHDSALCEFQHDAHDDNGKPEEHREQLDEELCLVIDDFAHGNVCRDISDRLAGAVLQGPVDGKQPSVLVVGNDGLDGFAFE